jgi:hypothetical protein
MASIGENTLFRWSSGLLGSLPGMNGPVNRRRMEEINAMIDTFRDALLVPDQRQQVDSSRWNALMDIIREVSSFVNDARFRQDSGPVLEELLSVIQMVAVEVLEIRGSRAMRSIFRVERTPVR